MANFSYYCLVVLFLSFFLKLVYNIGRKKSPPSPLALPIIGHYYLIQNSADHLALAPLSSQYGPIFFLRLGCRSFCVISSPSLVKECFTKNDMSFAQRPKFMAADHCTFNYELFVWAPYGHLWKTIRRLTVVELFSTNSLQNSSTIREEEIQTVLTILFKSLKNRSPNIILNYFIFTFISNCTMRLIAGKQYVKEEDIATKIGKSIIEKLASLSGPVLFMNVCDYFPILKLFGYKGLEKKIISLQKKKDDLVQEIIDEAKKQITKRKKNATLVGTFLSLQESDPNFYTDDVIKSVLLLMFVAGISLPKLAINSAMWLLSTHPDELHKLQTEIDNIVGHDRLLKESDLVKLPYLRCVVNETLRLFPPLPLLNPHVSSEDCVVGGYDIPKDTILVVNAWAMHRDNKVWEEPNKFKPERFLGIKVDKEDPKLVPFGMGRRICPGENMSLRTISLAVGAFVQCFDWKISAEEDIIEMSNAATVVVGIHKPLNVLCIPRGRQTLFHI